VIGVHAEGLLSLESLQLHVPRALPREVLGCGGSALRGSFSQLLGDGPANPARTALFPVLLGVSGLDTLALQGHLALTLTLAQPAFEGVAVVVLGGEGLLTRGDGLPDLRIVKGLPGRVCQACLLDDGRLQACGEAVGILRPP
jgi:hypothetical protein